MANWTRLNVAERRTKPPTVAVSTIAFSLSVPAFALVGDSEGRTLPMPNDARCAPGAASDVWIPLVRRIRAPFKGTWALPGGPIQWNQTLTETAMQTLVSATDIEPNYLEQLYSFGSVERSAQAERLVTIAYWAQYSHDDIIAWGEGQAPRSRGEHGDGNVAWFSVDQLPALAFDHGEIIRVGLERLRAKTTYSVVAHRFLGPEFTLAQLRAVYEVILEHRIDPANFRRQILASKTVEETGNRQTGSKHRPAKLYRFAPRSDGFG